MMIRRGGDFVENTMTQCQPTSSANNANSAADEPKTTTRKRSRLGRRIALVAVTLVVGFIALMVGESFGLPPEVAVDPSEPDRPSVREIPNFHRVETYFYRGAMPTVRGVKWLKEHGVKTIIDVRDKPLNPILGEGITARLMGFNYIHMPITTMPSEKQTNDFLACVEEASRDSAKAPIFLHCAHGSDRTGYLVALWRMKHEGWRWSKALSEMFHYGFLIHRFDGDREVELNMKDPSNWGGPSLPNHKPGQERGLQ